MTKRKITIEIDCDAEYCMHDEFHGCPMLYTNRCGIVEYCAIWSDENFKFNKRSKKGPRRWPECLDAEKESNK
jgi:hypothetical protein